MTESPVTELPPPDSAIDEHGQISGWRGRQARFHPQDRPEVANILRTVMDRLNAAKHCRRRDCRRARRCVAPKIDCAFQHLDLLQAHVFPLMERAAAEVGEPGSEGRSDLATLHQHR